MYVRDLWLTKDGRKTARHPDCGGNRSARRWLAVWADRAGDEHTKTFAKRWDADQFLAVKEKARVRNEILAADGDGIDPVGWYVYLLWEVADDAVPLYVGCSGNILARLGAHLGNSDRRYRVGWVTLIRCTSQKAMLAREGALIRKYRPEWNKHVPREEDGSAAAAPGRPSLALVASPGRRQQP